MFRLGLRLSLNSGREALIRLLLTVAAVAIGVTVLLAVFADFHAFQRTSKTPSWSSTEPAHAKSGTTADLELWNYSESIYKGQFIKQVDVAALGSKAPVPTGITRLPRSGQYYASPALAALLRSVPRDQLGARFPGSQVGTIGQHALTGPNELAVIVGYRPRALAAVPNTIRVDKISTAPSLNGTTNLYRLAFGVGAIALLFPLFILISTASRLSATRREERYAAMRLVGATPRQITAIATADAVAGAVIGTLVGIGMFLLVRPALADITLSGARFYAAAVTPTVWGYAAILVLVPLAAAAGAFLSLRRVQTSPFSVARRVTPPPPKIWRLIPFAIGVPLFVLTIALSHQRSAEGHGDGAAPSPGPALLGLLLIMVGLIVGGPWLTMQAAKLLTRISTGASSLLAARRLADNPKAAFRTISGLVLAVFVATAIGVLAATVNAAQSTTTADTELSDVLRIQYGQGPGVDKPHGHSRRAIAAAAGGLSRQRAAGLISKLESYHGVEVLPFYSLPVTRTPSGRDPGVLGPGNDTVVSCQSLKQLPALGACAPGLAAVKTNADILGTDNPLILNRDLPLIDHGSPASSATLARLRLGTLLVKTTTAADLERIRTFLATSSAATSGGVAPQTFGETAAIRTNDAKNIERAVLFATGLTLLVAGCSLAVSVGGALVERKRPFTLLRLSGTSRAALSKVVLLESLLPLLTAAVVAVVTGLAVAVPVVHALVPKGVHTALPGSGYFLTMGVGLAVVVAVVVSALPLLSRLTQPNNARFE